MLQDILINTAAAAAAAAPAAASNAESLQKLGFSHMVQNLDFISAGVLVILVIMSVGAWWYTIVNLIKNAVVRTRADRVMRTFWETPNAQDAIRFMEEQKSNEPFSKIALDCAQAAAHHQRHEGSRLVEALNRSEFIDRALRQAVTRESANLENGLTWLATVGATAPFVGLLGTVWGIYHALLSISAAGTITIERVSGPVGEALVMTAAGLAVAIPAVLAYNVFGKRVGASEAELEGFAHDLREMITDKG